MARTNTRRMQLLRTEFFEQGRRLDAAGDPAADCWLCKQRIRYDVPPSSSPDSHNLDHLHPVSTHPELQEDRDGFRHSHMSCNTTRGAKAPAIGGLGEQVAAWW